MSEIHEFVSAHCPFERADKYLERFLLSLPKDDGGGILALRAHLADFTMERDAHVILRRVREIPAFTMLDIEWGPKDGGPYPHFSGTLTTSDEAVGWSRLDLDGSYTPPLGPVGAAFDATLGHRIAVSTAIELLERLKGELEKSFGAEQG
jgi:hypothetical protein